MKQAFDKKVRPREFKEGDLVVKRAFSGGALILTTMDGDELPRPVNSDAVKRYFV